LYVLTKTGVKTSILIEDEEIVMNVLSGQVLWGGVALGLGAIAAPTVIPSVASAVRPVAKTLIKQGILLYRKGEQVATDVRDGWNSIIEEAISEIRADSNIAGGPCAAVEDPAQQVSDCSQY
jgi:hypothetical protein